MGSKKGDPKSVQELTTVFSGQILDNFGARGFFECCKGSGRSQDQKKFADKLRTRQRSGEGVVRGSSRPKCVFGESIFFSALRFALKHLKTCPSDKDNFSAGT